MLLQEFARGPISDGLRLDDGLLSECGTLVINFSGDHPVTRLLTDHLTISHFTFLNFHFPVCDVASKAMTLDKCKMCNGQMVR